MGQTPAFTKPRFPASVFRRLCKYPRRVCQNPACGRPFAPHLLPDGKLEQLVNFEKRKTCSKACMVVVRGITKGGAPKPEPRTWPEKLAERNAEPVRGDTLPLVARSCDHCGNGLVRRENEPPGSFNKRRFCSLEHARLWRSGQSEGRTDEHSGHYNDKVNEALRLFHGRYPGMTPHVAWQEHGEDATAYWLECLEQGKALS